MHEVSIALAIVDEIAERIDGQNIEKVTAVHLRIGAMTGVVPEALRFAWELAADGTPAAGSRLEIERVPLTIYCSACACERTVAGSMLPVCAVCGASSNDIVRGRELLVASMEVEYDASLGGSAAKHSAQEQHDGAGSSHAVRT
ncbi:MAG: hydrogenase maturation nickel metallochaperone HypA [Candidatus Baltobacteraceae bacterium]